MPDPFNSDDAKEILEQNLNAQSEMTQHMQEMLHYSTQAMMSMISPFQSQDHGDHAMKRMEHIGTIFQKVAEGWQKNPEEAAKYQQKLGADLISTWMGIMDKAIQKTGDNGNSSQHDKSMADKRYQDDAWQDIPFYAMLRQSHDVFSTWLKEVVETAPDLDPQMQHRAQFFLEQFVAATSPANFAMTNPEVIKKAIETKGKSISDGLAMMAEDMERGSGTLKLRHSDPNAFEVGGNLATTKGDVVFENPYFQLIHYKALSDDVVANPLLIIPPWINKFYVLDLTEEKSFIRYFIEQGHSVFVVSWVNADETTRDFTFEDYMQQGVLKAIDIVSDICDGEKPNIVGYCVGGTMLAYSAAYLAAQKKDYINSLTFLTTQVDFTHAGDLLAFVDEAQISTLEAEMQERGYIHAHQMSNAFNMLRARDLIWPFFVKAYLLGEQPQKML